MSRRMYHGLGNRRTTATASSAGQFRRGGRRRRSRARLLVVAATLSLPGFPVSLLAGQVAQASATPVSMSHCPSGMTEVTDGQFRVFACDDGPTAAADEQAALTDLGDLYLPETGLMGSPLPDFQVPHENGRIDVYLVTKGQAVTREGQTIDLAKLKALGAAPWDAISGTVSSGYIVALRPESLVAGQSMNSVLAHEFFHVLQYSHNTTLSCPKFWFLEASALWAEWWFAPATAGTMVYPYVTEFQAKPEVSLTDSANRKPYDDWLWPLFMQQQAGVGSIASAWTAMEDKTGCTALNAAINLQVPFHSSFGDFAVENFDYQLANTYTGVQAWPVNFGADYPDFTTAANPAAPAFPKNIPKHNSVTPGKSSYPLTATVPVNLPPLSAKYTKVSLVSEFPYFDQYLGGGGSVEFDFSGLSPSGNLDVTLLGADEQASGAATHNGVWERVDLTGGNTHAKICLSADGTKQDHPLTGEFYVIVANHSSGPSAAPITGSYTVSQRTACATALSGPLTIRTTTDDGYYHTQQSANITVNMANSPFENGGTGFGPWQVAPGGRWSEQYTRTYPCGDGTNETLSASGSGKVAGADINVDFVNNYMEPYSFKPYFASGLLSETAPATESGNCPDGVNSAFMAIGQGCPGTTVYFNGVYTSGDAGVNLTCSGKSKGNGITYTVKISGTLTATDPIVCGLWTSNCSIGSVPMTRSKPSKPVPSVPEG
jgi:hypothetical protein